MVQLHNVHKSHVPSTPLFYTHLQPASTRSLLSLLSALPGDVRLALAGTELSIRHDLLRSQFDRGDVGGLVGNDLLEFLLRSLLAAVLES